LFVIKSIKLELQTKPIYDCRCDERRKPKDDESTCLSYTGLFEELEYLKIFLFVYYESIKRKLETKYIWGSKDRDEVNRREVCECDG
jgi:hypothetical protein